MDSKSKNFLALQKRWYDKLEKEGFNDIEQDEDKLKVWVSHRFKAKFAEFKAPTWQAKEEYYRLAGHFLHDYEFKNAKQKLIWQLHSEGVAVEDIVATMKTRRFKVYKRFVHETIQVLAEEMGKQCRKR